MVVKSYDVIVINHDRSDMRRRFQQAQMRELNLAWERLAAVDAQGIDDATYKKLGFGWLRPLRRTELACFLSHKAVWERTAARNRPALVLEDDAFLSNHTLAALDALAQMQDCDFVSLEVRGQKKLVGPAMAVAEGFAIRRLYQNRSGAAAYLLFPSGARKLLERAGTRAPGLADAFIAAAYALASFQLDPAIAIQLDQTERYGRNAGRIMPSSLIDAEQIPRFAGLPIRERVIFSWRRVKGEFAIGRQLFANIWRGKRLLIPLVDGFTAKEIESEKST